MEDDLMKGILKEYLTLSCIFSFIVLPFVSIGFLFYHLFSKELGSGEIGLLFNTITLDIGEKGFSFFVSPAYLVLMLIVFVFTFFFFFLINKLIAVFKK
jgi:ABC-type tungstate transport system substrate-binding protein